MAVLTFGVQGLTGGTAEPAPTSAPVTGVVGPEPLAAVFSAFPAAATATSAAAEVPGALAPGAFAADASALLGFSRSLVETSSELGGPGELNVASAGLQRPAPGWLMAPLESLRESSSYGLRRSPLTGQSGEFHWGQDYGAACGTRVYSADAGVVRAVGWHPWGGGNRVEIDHGNGLITTYNHLEAIAVKKGDSVRVSEVIARVGTTGSSTGCHLHFETILNGAHTDPHGWKLLPTTQVDPLSPIDMTSYEPEADKSSNATIGWAIPVRTDRTHEVTGGDEETPVAAVPVTPSSPPASTVPGLTSMTATPTPTLPDLTLTPATPTSPTTTTPGTSTPGTSTPGTSTPGTTAPGTSTPGTSTPGTSTPGASTPGTSTPGTSTPGTTAPGTSTPGTSTPGASTPGTSTPGTSTPGTSTPGTSAPGTSAPGTSAPGTTTPGTSTPGTTTPGTPAPGKPSSTTAPLPSVPPSAPIPPAATASQSATAPRTPAAPTKPATSASSTPPPKKSPVATPAPTTRTATPGSASATATEAAATRAPTKKPKG